MATTKCGSCGQGNGSHSISCAVAGVPDRSKGNKTVPSERTDKRR